MANPNVERTREVHEHIVTLDPSPSFADLLLWDLLERHEVAFPVHQHLNHLVLELVVFVVVSAVVPDSVQTLVADVLVPVLARPCFICGPGS